MTKVNLEIEYGEAVSLYHAVEDWLRYAKENNKSCDITLAKQELVLAKIKEAMKNA